MQSKQCIHTHKNFICDVVFKYIRLLYVSPTTTLILWNPDLEHLSVKFISKLLKRYHPHFTSFPRICVQFLCLCLTSAAEINLVKHTYIKLNFLEDFYCILLCTCRKQMHVYYT